MYKPERTDPDKCEVIVSETPPPYSTSETLEYTLYCKHCGFPEADHKGQRKWCILQSTTFEADRG